MNNISDHGDRKTHILARFQRAAKRRNEGLVTKKSKEEPGDLISWDIWFPPLIDELVKLHTKVELLERDVAYLKQPLHQKAIQGATKTITAAKDAAIDVKNKIKYSWNQWLNDDSFDLNDMADEVAQRSDDDTE